MTVLHITLAFSNTFLGLKSALVLKKHSTQSTVNFHEFLTFLKWVILNNKVNIEQQFLANIMRIWWKKHCFCKQSSNTFKKNYYLAYLLTCYVLEWYRVNYPYQGCAALYDFIVNLLLQISSIVNLAKLHLNQSPMGGPGVHIFAFNRHISLPTW